MGRKRSGIGDAEAPLGDGVGGRLARTLEHPERPLADDRRVGARRRAAPTHPGSGRGPHRRKPGGRGGTSLPAGSGEDRARDPAIERLALGEAPRELLAVAGEGTPGALGAVPRGLLVHPTPDAEVLAERLANPLALHRPSPKRDHATALEQ